MILPSAKTRLHAELIIMGFSTEYSGGDKMDLYDYSLLRKGSWSIGIDVGESGISVWTFLYVKNWGLRHEHVPPTHQSFSAERASDSITGWDRCVTAAVTAIEKAIPILEATYGEELRLHNEREKV